MTIAKTIPKIRFRIKLAFNLVNSDDKNRDPVIKQQAPIDINTPSGCNPAVILETNTDSHNVIKPRRK